MVHKGYVITCITGLRLTKTLDNYIIGHFFYY
jgi:hypothetical protein